MIHIVDDNEMVLDVMVDLAEMFGFKAQRFSSARTYLDFSSSDASPAAVFTDVTMPDIDGFELMHRVHALHPDVRFVIMSGEDRTGQANRLGACFYLLKPIRPELLESTFQHLRQCLLCGPSQSLVDARRDERKHFGVTSQRCPFLAEK